MYICIFYSILSKFVALVMGWESRDILSSLVSSLGSRVTYMRLQGDPIHRGMSFFANYFPVGSNIHQNLSYCNLYNECKTNSKNV